MADLHLEKASWFAQGGQLLPPYDSIATLADLGLIVAAAAAEEIWCLGDSFHDKYGCDRLPEQARDMLTALTAATRWTWITGNHDPGFADHCGGEIAQEAEVDGLLFATRPIPTKPARAFGHFHPKLRISHRGRWSRGALRARSASGSSPFGDLTGGSTHHPEIFRAVGGALRPGAGRGRLLSSDRR